MANYKYFSSINVLKKFIKNDSGQCDVNSDLKFESLTKLDTTHSRFTTRSSSRSSSIHSLCCKETFRNSAFRSCNYSIQGAKGSPSIDSSHVGFSLDPPSFTSYSAGCRAVFCRGLNDSWMFDKYLCLRESRRRSIAGSLLRRCRWWWWCHAMCVHYPDCAKTFEVFPLAELKQTSVLSSSVSGLRSLLLPQ